MSNLWELRVWLSVDENSIKNSTLKIKSEFQKAWDTIEKELGSSWKKWLKEIKTESEKTFCPLYLILESINTPLL